ncbi:hypothetical protein [Silvibacterium acidisoli]|uniref:hypothetical protein n=1 Tax=Acidobacteriaceae bacterium ZG23-2 TaxID=2883246 RepID=UPI00406C19EA
MISALQRASLSFHSLVARAAGPQQEATPAVPKVILDWLARLFTLEGVPFEYLVVNPVMLPQESVRFFVIDANWLYRAVEGAVSAGVSSSRDVIATLRLLESQLGKQLPSYAMTLRSRARGLAVEDPPPPAPNVAWSGCLIRSIAVSGWPGIEVAATDSTGKACKLIRMDRLSPSVLFCLFAGVATTVNVMEPPETLHFGVFFNQSQGYVFLRSLGYNGSTPGKQVTPNIEQNVAFRSSTAYPGVVKTASTAVGLQNALLQNGLMAPGSTITAAEYAVQMVQAAGLQSFEQGAS